MGGGGDGDGWGGLCGCAKEGPRAKETILSHRKRAFGELPKSKGALAAKRHRPGDTQAFGLPLDD